MLNKMSNLGITFCFIIFQLIYFLKQQKVQINIDFSAILKFMFKVTPIFPLSTKQKYTSTQLNSNCFSFIPMNCSSQNFFRSNYLSKKESDSQRIQELSKPKALKASNINFLSTCSTFTNKNKNSQNFEQNNSLIMNFKKVSSEKRNSYRKNIQLSKQNIKQLKYPNIQAKKLINEIKSQLNKPNQKQNAENQNHDIKQSRVNCRKHQHSLQFQLMKKKRQIKDQKKKNQFIGQLNSSNLSKIYNNLYAIYQQKPFNQLQQSQPILINFLDSLIKQSQEQQTDKYKLKKEMKSFEMKEVQRQKNLRKQIKSLTRDTDHILSLEFKDIRDINNSNSGKGNNAGQ